MPIVPPFSRVVCPTCGQRFSLADAYWRDYRKDPEPCPEMKEALQLDGMPSAPPARPPSGWSWTRWFTPGNGKHWKKVCPKCRVDLPDLMANGLAAAERFAVLGGPYTGKSQLIWAWLHQLQNLPPELGLSVQLVRTYDVRTSKVAESEVLWRDRYDRYPNPPRERDGTRPRRRAVIKTPVFRVEPPLIVRLTMTRRPLWHRLTHPWADFRPIDLLFYDTCGETYLEGTLFDQFAGYALSATGFILLVDPFSCEEFSSWMKTTTSQGEEQSTFRRILGNLRRTYVDAHRLGMDQKFSTDAAIVLTKSDTLQPWFEQDNPTAPGVHPIDHRNGFSVHNVNAASRDIEEYLRVSERGGLLNDIRANFHQHRFFSCSALGRQPIGREQYLNGPPESFRVLEPLLWLLHRRGYLPAEPLPACLNQELPEKDQ